MTRIAVMQGYFLPYAGYFRLMCDVDAFVLCGGHQFLRRGWIHRNRLRDDVGELGWLTLPLAPSPVETRIADIRYGEDAAEILRKNARRFAACRTPRDHTAALVERALAVEGTPWETIVSLLQNVRSLLGLSAPVIMDSELGLPGHIKREDLILEICRRLSADTYLNAPGGKHLYTQDMFTPHGIRLEFLPEYRGDPSSILQRLHDSSPAEIRAEIRSNLAP